MCTFIVIYTPDDGWDTPHIDFKQSEDSLLTRVEYIIINSINFSSLTLSHVCNAFIQTSSLNIILRKLVKLQSLAQSEFGQPMQRIFSSVFLW